MEHAEDFELCARRLKALADAERLRIISCLFGGPKYVGDLATQLNDEVVKVSHHLGVLRNAGLVITRKNGRFVEYALHPDVVPTLEKAGVAKQIDLGCCRLSLEPGAAGRRKP
jgi:DNA-binding transcriptional ArsR family regulator